MCSYGYTPVEWFSQGRRPRSSYYPTPMSQPVSKSFNRISDFIFPDTIHVRFPPSQQQHPPPPYEQYHRTQNYSLPALNRQSFPQRDLIIVERLPVGDVDLLYREQHYHPKTSIRRRYSSIVDERHAPTSERTTTGLANRSSVYRDRVRDRRKRHTTENAYHSLLKSMLEEDEQQQCTNERDSNCVLSYRTTLDPITDSESMTSIHQPQRQQPQQQHISNNSFGRVPINGTIPIFTERERLKQQQRRHSSSMSSRNSSSDTETIGRCLENIEHQHQSAYIHSSKISLPVWERLQHQPDRFIPINPLRTDTNNHETMSSSSNHRISSSPFDNVINHQINNQPSASHDSTHQVSLCVNDLHTTLFIDEDALKQTKATNNNSNTGKAVVKTFVDRIIKRLQHFKYSLDQGLIHVRRRNTLVNGTIIAEHTEPTREKRSEDLVSDHKVVRPYFLIQPQTALLLPNETAKLKCCFGGDPFPTLLWSHNEARVPELLPAGRTTTSKYRMHKLHDIHYLDIGPIELRDSGSIKCTVINRFGREEAIAQLLVVPSPADGLPCITQTLKDVRIIEGQPLKLSCGVNGLQVMVNWFHNGKLISPTAQSKSDYNNENAIFTLSSCLRSDAGTVDCLVKNRFGDVRTSCRIEVINDPELDR